MSNCEKHSEEYQQDYQHYRRKCRATGRGDGIHDLWVKLAWMNRGYFRQWRVQQ